MRYGVTQQRSTPLYKKTNRIILPRQGVLLQKEAITSQYSQQHELQEHQYLGQEHKKSSSLMTFPNTSLATK